MPDDPNTAATPTSSPPSPPSTTPAPFQPPDPGLTITRNDPKVPRGSSAPVKPRPVVEPEPKPRVTPTPVDPPIRLPRRDPGVEIIKKEDPDKNK